MFTKTVARPLCKIVKMGGKLWKSYILGDHCPSGPLTTPMVLWLLHSTVLVLDNDY